MNKLVFKSPPPRPVRKHDKPVIRISAEAFDLIEEISAKTGLSNAFVASKMIEYAAQNTEIVYGDEE